MFGGIIEVVAGGILIAIPDPATSMVGAALVADGVRRMADEIEGDGGGESSVDSNRKDGG